LPESLVTQAHEEPDTGPRRVAPGSERFCAATGAVRPVADMIRFVVAPDGQVVPDLQRRLPGRGIWITATASALATAIDRRAFGRGLKQEVRPGPELIALTERLLEKEALDALAIAHKAGKVAIGFTKAEAAFDRGQVAALIHAEEAAGDGRRKLDGRSPHPGAADGGKAAGVVNFTSTQLNLALGRSNVIHAALLVGRESETFLARIARLNRFRAADLGSRRTRPNKRPDRTRPPEVRDLNG
jgi:predicted RNA-binding protein YlxR (DUF448 family)